MMENEQIVRRLEYCSSASMCKDCSYFGMDRCAKENVKDAIALIKELIKENKDLREDLEVYYRNCPTF